MVQLALKSSEKHAHIHTFTQDFFNVLLIEINQNEPLNLQTNHQLKQIYSGKMS